MNYTRVYQLNNEFRGPGFSAVLETDTHSKLLYRSSFRQGIISYSNYRQAEPVLAIGLISDEAIRNFGS